MNSPFKKSLLTVMLVWLLGFGYAQRTLKIGLQEAIQFAVENNLEIKNAQLNILDADQQIYERRAIGLPNISAAFDYNRYLKIPTSVLPAAFEELIKLGNGGELPPDFSPQVSFALKHNITTGINFRSMIFDGSYFTGLKAARLYRTLVQEELADQLREVQNRVIDAYIPPLYFNENLKILDKNITNLEKLLFETKALYKEGFVEQLDVDRLELSLANLLVEKDNLVREKASALNRLKMVMGFEKEIELLVTDDIEKLLSTPSKNDLEGGVNYFNRTDYKLTVTSIKLNQLNITYNKNFYLPTLSLNASYNQTFQGNQLFGDPNSFWAPTALVGLSLNVPIFDGFDKRSKIERARLSYEIAKNRQTQLAQLINMEVKNARIKYKGAIQKLESQKQNLALAERIYNTTQIKYKEGVGSSLEVTTAEQSLFDTQRNYTLTLFELLAAKLELDKVLGR